MSHSPRESHELNSPNRLSNTGLSIDQYATLLGLRREGVSKLLSVCDESVPEQERRTMANTALNHFFEARQIVAN